MENAVRKDPILYAGDWAKTIRPDVPVRGEIDHCIWALTHHAALLYCNPLTEQLRPRDRFRLIRRQLSAYTKLIEERGFIPALKTLKDLALVFLKSFTVDTENRTVFYAADELRTSPLWGACAHLSGSVVTEANIKLFRFILSWHVFLSKLPLTRPDLSEAAKTAWIERQVSPIQTTYQADLLLPLRHIVGWLFELYPEFVGSHGPGSTAGGAKTVPDKNAKFRASHQTALLLRYSPDGPISQRRRRTYKLPSEYSEAPKDIGSVRPITQMPVDDQFAQQGLKYFWYAQTDLVCEDLLSRYTRFSDQTPSRVLAQRGSDPANADRRAATIDLKNSSDTVSVDLVCNLFSGDTLHYIMLARSPRCKVGRKIIETSMYDGMGSALTFPVQTTIFVAVAIWATILWLTKDELFLTWEECIQTVLGPHGFRKQYLKWERLIRVYGDDIELPDGAALIAVDILQELGLVVNVDKSFIGSIPIRESCGFYGIGGLDATPHRCTLPILAEASLTDAAFFESLRDHTNMAYAYGYKQLYRSYLREAMVREPFINSDDLKLKRSRKKSTSHYRNEYGTPRLLFDSNVRNETTIGFYSDFDSVPTHRDHLWGPVPVFTTYRPKTVTVSDKDSDFYHLTLWWRDRVFFQMDDSDVRYHLEPGTHSSPDLRKRWTIEDFVWRLRSLGGSGHGKIPRGVRLEKANARTVRSPKDRYASSWEWAPS
jgi:hypothetical protein